VSRNVKDIITPKNGLDSGDQILTPGQKNKINLISNFKIINKLNEEYKSKDDSGKNILHKIYIHRIFFT
jgi:hypothetical protein